VTGNRDLIVVIPALNEAASVAAVIDEVRMHLPSADILVIDDGSTDATTAVAKQSGALVARLPYNLGVGGALRTGFRFAADHGYRAVVQVDADGQHDPSAAAELVERLSSADLVLGARFAGTGDYTVRGPRRWAMKFLAHSLSRVARTRLTDTTSGFRAFGPRAIRLFAVDYPAEYLGDTIEALVIGAKAGLVVTQMPVAMRARTGGVASHRPLRAATSLLRTLLALLFALTRPRTSIPGEIR
jgi:glycosyltransferase involved in cell wall biosynthesis